MCSGVEVCSCYKPQQTANKEPAAVSEEGGGGGRQRGDVREEEMKEEKSFFPLKCESTEPEAQQARSSPWWSVTERHCSGYLCTALTKKINLIVPALIHQ